MYHRPPGQPFDRVGDQHPRGQLADLELHHRRRARAKDRIHAAKDTGPANLPLHGLVSNQVWIELVMLALDLIAWTQMLALAGHTACRWKPKRLRLRLFSTAARLVRTGRRQQLRSNRSWPWGELLSAVTYTDEQEESLPGAHGPWRQPERIRAAVILAPGFPPFGRPRTSLHLTGKVS